MEVVNKNVSSKEKMLERIKSLSSSKSNKRRTSKTFCTTYKFF